MALTVMMTLYRWFAIGYAEVPMAPMRRLNYCTSQNRSGERKAVTESHGAMGMPPWGRSRCRPARGTRAQGPGKARSSRPPTWRGERFARWHAPRPCGSIPHHPCATARASHASVSRPIHPRQQRLRPDAASDLAHEPFRRSHLVV